MTRKSGFYGFLLILLLLTAVISLFTSENQITGLVVKEINNDDARDNIGLSCNGKISHGSCSVTKPLFCDDGQLVYNCYECGCNPGDTCSEYGICIPIETCADGSIYGECSTGLKGSFCDNGRLVDNCELCGCDEDEVCSDNKCISNE